jgi:sigma-B regulation protein RsbU (phosphoserine phosphatase)
MIVGAFPKARYQTVEVKIPESSRLYLFSDGVYEIDRPDGTMMSYTEFAELLCTPGGDSRVSSIVTEVKRQNGSDFFADDFSLVEFLFQSEKSPQS